MAVEKQRTALVHPLVHAAGLLSIFRSFIGLSWPSFSAALRSAASKQPNAVLRLRWLSEFVNFIRNEWNVIPTGSDCTRYSVPSLLAQTSFGEL
jgi:hypothetical protein